MGEDAVFDNDLPIEVNRILIQREIDSWKAARRTFQIRFRVTKGLGEDTKALIGELERCERAIELLTEDLVGLV